MARAGQMCAPALMPSGVRVFLRLFFKFSWVVGVWRGRVRASSPLSPGGFRWCKWHYRSFSPLPNIHFRSAFSPFSPQIQFCDVVRQWSHHCVILAHYADDSQSPTITPFKGIGLTRSRKRTLQWELFFLGNGWGGGVLMRKVRAPTTGEEWAKRVNESRCSFTSVGWHTVLLALKQCSILEDYGMLET